MSFPGAVEFYLHLQQQEIIGLYAEKMQAGIWELSG
jgi:hypothetical protein